MYSLTIFRYDYSCSIISNFFFVSCFASSRVLSRKWKLKMTSIKEIEIEMFFSIFFVVILLSHKFLPLCAITAFLALSFSHTHTRLFVSFIMQFVRLHGCRQKNNHIMNNYSSVDAIAVTIAIDWIVIILLFFSFHFLFSVNWSVKKKRNRCEKERKCQLSGREKKKPNRFCIYCLLSRL